MRKTKILKLTIFTVAVFGLGVFVFSSEAQAATTHYVSPSGSGPDCSNTAPCALSYGVNTKASPGDTVIAKAGTYHESLTITKAGVTLQGTLDANGNRLSIIDPYVNVSGGWVEDTRIGTGVYKKTLAIKSETMAVEIAGVRYKIFKLCQDEEEELYSPDYNHCQDTQIHLARPTTVTYPINEGSISGYINFWDGFNVLFTSKESKETWIRFDDRTNVNSLTLLAPNDANYMTIRVNADNVTIKDLKIYSDRYGIYIENNKSGITIDNNEILLGNEKIHAETSNNLTITNNILTDQSYSASKIGTYTRGSWQQEYTAYNDTKNMVNMHHYNFTKYPIAFDRKYASSGIYVSSTTNCTITGNLFTDMRQPLVLYYYGNTVDISNNTFKQLDIGIIPANHTVSSTISNNYFEDTLYAIRFHPWEGDFNGATGDYYNNTSINMYGNTSWNPPHKGGHIFFYYNSTSFAFVDADVSVANDIITETAHGLVNGLRVQLTTTGVLPAGLSTSTNYYIVEKTNDTFKLSLTVGGAAVDITEAEGGGTHTCMVYYDMEQTGQLWVYHNSFSGGDMVNVSANAKYFYNSMKGVYFVNNIFSSQHRMYMDQSYASTPAAAYYNWFTGTYDGIFLHASNIDNGTSEMTGWSGTTPHSFDVTGTNAENAGCDVTDKIDPYECVANLSSLPGFTAGYYSNLPDMGAVQTGVTNPADVNKDGRVNIKDIQEVIRCIINSQTCAFPDRSNVNNDDRINIKDIQAIIREIIAPN